MNNIKNQSESVLWDKWQDWQSQSGTNQKKEKAQTNTIKDEKEEVATDCNEFQRIIWENFENLCLKKLEKP